MIKFQPEHLNFHREEYQAHLAEIRPKDYPLLSEKKVVGRMNLRHRRENPYVKDGRALVSFVMAQGDIREDIRKAVDRIGGFEKAFTAQDRIFIKPNYNSDDPPPGSTALDFMGAAIDLLRDHGYGNITVGEGSGRPWVPSRKVFDTMGVSEKLSRMGVPLMDLDQCEYADVSINGDFLNEVAYPKELEEFDKIIYLPTMKTHYVAGFSMSLKLVVGLTHLYDRFKLHADNNMFVSQRSVEMALPVRPDLIIMDGRVSFVSGGPAIGLAVHPGVILASGDPVAIDVQGIRLLQNYAAVNHLTGDPWTLPQIRTAVRHGVGVKNDAEYLLIRE